MFESSGEILLRKMSPIKASEIPVIDFMDDSLKPGTDTWFSATQIMRSSLESNGCFYAMSNKVSTELQNSVLALMQELFNLPIETKKKNSSLKPYHSYYQPSPQLPLYESFAIDFDGPFNNEAVQNFTNLMWPTGYDHFCETINEYAKLLVGMEQTAKRLLFDAYGLEKRHCDSLRESTGYLLRSFKYLVPHNNENDLGLRAHTDMAYFTILHQINNVAGLQVKLKSGDWIDVDPLPCMFLFVAGDALKVWSNDRIDSCEHRVIIKEKKERFSIGLFSHNHDKVETEEELVDEEYPKRYKSFDHYEYMALREKFPLSSSKFSYGL